MPERYHGWTCQLCGPDPVAPCTGNYCPRRQVTYRVYVATALGRLEYAHAMIAQLRALEFEITYDWTVHGSLQAWPERWSPAAEAEARGVASADALVVLLPGGLGTHTELGIALGTHRRIVMVGTDPGDTERTCIFHHHPAILRVPTAADAVGVLRAWRMEKGTAPRIPLIPESALTLILPERKELTDAMGLPAAAGLIEIITQARTQKHAAAQAGVENSHLYKAITAALGDGTRCNPGCCATAAARLRP